MGSIFGSERDARSIFDEPKTSSIFDEAEGPEAEIADLERQLAATGSQLPGGSGVIRKTIGLAQPVIDLLSRVNYAEAGAVEEMAKTGAPFQPGAYGPAAARAGRELFSGLPGIKGEKRAFGEVMEKAGVPEGASASSVMPFAYSPTGEGLPLERGGMFDPTVRGMAGTALDIIADPLTYVTFGGNAVRRILLPRAGVKYLSKAGTEVVEGIRTAYRPALDAAEALTDDTLRMAERRNVLAAMDDDIEKALVTPAGKPVDKALFDPGGVKLFGKSVIPAETLAKVAEPVRSAVLSVPGAEQALKGAGAIYDGGKAFLNGLFAWQGDVANLPKGMRESSERLLRDHASATAAIRGRLFAEMAPIRDEWDRLAKADPGLGKKFYDWRQGTGAPALTQRQQDVFQEIARMYDELEANGLAVGILDPEQVAKFHGRYAKQSYLNVEDLGEVHPGWGQPGSGVPGAPKFTRERQFDTYAEAVKKSRSMNELGQMRRLIGEEPGVYPTLKPNYDPIQNLASYIHEHADAISRKWMYEDASRLFGIADPGAVVPDAIWDITHKIPVPPAEAERIGRFFSEPTFTKMAQAIGEDDWVKAWPDLRATAARQLGTLSTDGKREFFREMFTRIKSPSQFANIANDFEQYRTLMPAPKVNLVGQPEQYFSRFGEQAKYVERGGGGTLWGDKVIRVPELLAKEIEGSSAQAWKWMNAAGLKQFIQGWDWVNNWFKAGVYTFWPGSLTRDIYNNVAQAMLDIGVGALARPMKAAKIVTGVGPDEVLELGGRALTRRQWRKMAVDLGVVDESGQMFVQMTGKGGLRAPFRREARKPGVMARTVLPLRSKPENWSRIQLWVNNIDRGMDPRDAADKVREFLFNYGELSRPERELFRRAIPFYTFPRKAIALHVNALKRNPGMVINEVKPFRGRESEDSQLATWEGEALKLRLDRDGKTLRVLSGIDLPIKTLDTIKWPPSQMARGFWGMASPVGKMAVELPTGVDLFTGRAVKRRQAPAIGRFLDAYGPEWLKNWVGYDKTQDAAGRPVYTVDNQAAAVIFLRSWAFSRLLTASDRQFREYYAGDPQVAASMLDILTNLRVKELDLNEQQERKRQERLRLLREAVEARGGGRYVPIYQQEAR